MSDTVTIHRLVYREVTIGRGAYAGHTPTTIREHTEDYDREADALAAERDARERGCEVIGVYPVVVEPEVGARWGA